MNLIDLAILFRAINLYAHQAHNVISGQTFMQDHSFFAEVYGLMDSFYDDLIEREIGLRDTKINLSEITSKANALLGKAGDKHYETIESSLKHSLMMIKSIYSKESIGTQNLLAGQADQIEGILYKIKQRLK